VEGSHKFKVLSNLLEYKSASNMSHKSGTQVSHGILNSCAANDICKHCFVLYMQLYRLLA